MGFFYYRYGYYYIWKNVYYHLGIQAMVLLILVHVLTKVNTVVVGVLQQEVNSQALPL